VSWQERFRKIRDIADKQEAGERQRLRDEKKRLQEILKERRKTIRTLAPEIQKVCKQFNRGVRGKMTKHKPKEWSKVNFGWNLQTDFGGVRVRTWPWLRDPGKPLPVRGLWLQYLGPRGTSTVEERRARGTRLNDGENPTASGHYYWPLAYNDSHCTFGYFLSLDGFSEEKLARNLERIGHDLLRFSSEDFPQVPTEAVSS
jgi:hypothetical protein